jgi:hypothetical protein
MAAGIRSLTDESHGVSFFFALVLCVTVLITMKVVTHFFYFYLYNYRQ